MKAWEDKSTKAWECEGTKAVIADRVVAVSDFFIEGLRYEQIASKRGIALGSVGVYLKRGLDVMRKAAAQCPKLFERAGGIFAMSDVVMSDQRFFDLAMKVIAGQSTEPERAELDAALARDSESRKEFEQLRQEVFRAKEILP
jgi:hypothetical protein